MGEPILDPELIPVTIVMHHWRNTGWTIWRKLDKVIKTIAKINNANALPRKYLNSFNIT
jgi:hypothetical protein